MQGIPHEYLTLDLPGIGGEIKREFDDFQVVEVPLYTPCGEGEHTYLEIEKIDLATREAIERIAAALGVDPGGIGYAGLKDRKGVTRQTLSITLVDPERVRALEVPGLRVLWVNRHTNKLRVGHLKGNRFVIRVRQVCGDAEVKIAPILERIRAQGMPNFFGPQRFGVRADAHFIGRAVLRGDYRTAVERFLGEPASAEQNLQTIAARNRFMAGELSVALTEFPRQYRDEIRVLKRLVQHRSDFRTAYRRMRAQSQKMFLSAYQAYMFNVIVCERMRRLRGADGRPDLGRLLEGDLAFLHDRGAVFLVEDPPAEHPRAERLEISATGPLFGGKMAAPGGLPAEIEAEIAHREGFSVETMRGSFPSRILDGGRRPVRVPVHDLLWRRDGDDLVFEFFLPKGSYATTFLREVTKDETVPEEFYADDEDERHDLWRPEGPGTPEAIERVSELGE